MIGKVIWGGFTKADGNGVLALMERGSGKSQTLVGKGAVVAFADVAVAVAVCNVITSRGHAAVRAGRQTTEARSIDPIDADDHGGIIIRAQPEIYGCRRPISRSRGKIERDGRAGAIIIALTIGGDRLNKIPVGAPTILTHGIIYAIRKIEGVFQPFTPDGTGRR